MENKVEEKVVAKENNEAQQEGEQQEGGEKQLSKQQLKKQQKKLEKEAKKQSKEEDEKKKKDEENNDPCAQYYGDLELIQSQYKTDRVWTPVINIDESFEGKEVLVRARIHNTISKGKIHFLFLRENFSTVQVLIQIGEKNPTISKGFLKFVSKIPCESIVDVTAIVVKPPESIKATTQQVELHAISVKVVSRSLPTLPFQLEDASRKVIDNEEFGENEVQQVQEGQPITVGQKIRLDNRILDLRTPAKQAIFRVQSAIAQLFREFLYQNEFIEIHTPKLIAGSSEGGANVFKLKYFNQEACLAQSPQLYKQMCVMSDFKRVFEIGPVFRAENSQTHRHMCEFTGLDLEMEIKENYHELLDLMGDLLYSIFQGIEKKYSKELAAINEQFPFEPFVCAYPIVKLTFREGCKLLQEAGINQDPLEDLDTVNERKLGDIVKKKYNTDFYMLHEYPINARPFYTMLCKDDPNYTLSYDFFMRGEEITSGAQRNHDPKSLSEMAVRKGLDVNTISDYIKSFEYGSYPHGGCGIGLERVVFLYCNLKNIRNGSLFPRDPKRITP